MERVGQDFLRKQGSSAVPVPLPAVCTAGVCLLRYLRATTPCSWALSASPCSWQCHRHRQVPRGWAPAQPPATQHPERCPGPDWGLRVWSYTCVSIDFLLWEPHVSHPEVGFLATAASRNSNMEVPKPQPLFVTPGMCFLRSVFPSGGEGACRRCLVPHRPKTALN